MNIIAVDDEKNALWLLKKAIEKVTDHANVEVFDNASDVLSYAADHIVDVAFLDIDMPDMDGLNLAKKIKDVQPDTNIIFVTAYKNHTLTAFNLRASGYVVKPVSHERVADELENLRYPISDEHDRGYLRNDRISNDDNRNNDIRIQCFGNFDVFAGGIPLVFGRPKAKELLAYLVDRRGAGIDKKEMSAVLWEEQPYTRSIQSHLHILINHLMEVLGKADAENIIIKQRGIYSVDPSKFECDYYDYNKGIVSAVNSYRGEYMSNYSWAEFTAGVLSSRM